MKSLVLKDLFNISHNANSMIFILLVFAIIFIPTSGAQAFIFISAILCSNMIITTFSFDESSKWTRYAMILPISKQELVAAKFMVLIIFCTIGSIFGLIVGIIGNLIINNPIDIKALLFLTIVAWAISIILGGISIPLAFKFGTEKSRILKIISLIIPVGFCFILYHLLRMLEITLTDQVVSILLYSSPFIALICSNIMYQVSYKIFIKQEL